MYLGQHPLAYAVCLNEDKIVEYLLDDLYTEDLKTRQKSASQTDFSIAKIL